MLYVSPLKALEQRHPQEPRRAVVGHRVAGCRARPDAAADSNRRSHRRHPGLGAAADGQASAAHSGDDTGVAVHSADGRSQPAGAAQRSDRHRRRDSRHGRRQAGRASGAVARAPRRSGAEGRRRDGRSASACPRRSGRSKPSRASWRPTRAAAASPSSITAIAARWISPSRCRRTSSGLSRRNEMWQEIYDRIAALIHEHRTTLVFVNTRRLAERVAHHLGERLGEDAVLAHHGSLSRKLRLTAEERLKTGKLKAVVATASLELGIDIGTVDLVCQIGSPRSIAVALQRIGRSGHQVEHTTKPKGRIFATTRDELIECAALDPVDSAGELDRLDRSVDAARRAGAADRRDGRGRRLAGGRTVRAGSTRVLLCRPDAWRVRRGHRDAVGRDQHQARPQRRVPPSRSRARRRSRPARGAAGGDHVGRRDSGQRAVSRPRRAGRDRGRHARRGLRGRKHGGRRVSARAPRRGASGGSRPAACAWKMPRARRPRFRSGAAKRPGRTWELSKAVSELRERILEASPSRHFGQSTSSSTSATSTSAGPSRRCFTCARARGARSAADRRHRRGRAVLRRRRRDAARPALAVRCPHQSGVGSGAAQALLPVVQFRAPGGRNRQRHRHFAERPAQLSAGARLQVPEQGDGRGGADAGDAARADVRGAMAMEHVARAGRAAVRRRPQGAAADSAHARRRPARRGFSRPGGVPGEHRRRHSHSRSSARQRDDQGLPARSDGPRRLEAARGAHRHAASSRPSRSTRRSPRRSRTKSSTRIRTPTWTMRRSRNAGREPFRCGARLGRMRAV